MARLFTILGFVCAFSGAMEAATFTVTTNADAGAAGKHAGDGAKRQRDEHDGNEHHVDQRPASHREPGNRGLQHERDGQRREGEKYAGLRVLR